MQVGVGRPMEREAPFRPAAATAAAGNAAAVVRAVENAMKLVRPHNRLRFNSHRITTTIAVIILHSKLIDVALHLLRNHLSHYSHETHIPHRCHRRWPLRPPLCSTTPTTATCRLAWRAEAQRCYWIRRDHQWRRRWRDSCCRHRCLRLLIGRITIIVPDAETLVGVIGSSEIWGGGVGSGVAAAAAEGGVPVVLDGVICASGEQTGNGGPLIPKLRVGRDDRSVLRGSKRPVVHIRTQLIAPPEPARLARPPGILSLIRLQFLAP
uniref:Uncharacterized protein n=1 Tax=Ananas comosus var. bracteatus TaxID=296719 RepID=A0A6V7PDB0_ANACO|nr:unnamed protein product [Ananas comosus var. bracteatus]